MYQSITKRVNDRKRDESHRRKRCERENSRDMGHNSAARQAEKRLMETTLSELFLRKRSTSTNDKNDVLQCTFKS